MDKSAILVTFVAVMMVAVAIPVAVVASQPDEPKEETREVIWNFSNITAKAETANIPTFLAEVEKNLTGQTFSQYPGYDDAYILSGGPYPAQFHKEIFIISQTAMQDLETAGKTIGDNVVKVYPQVYMGDFFYVGSL